MSYTIVYDKKFVKVGNGTYIPCCLWGSNNCTQMSSSGREIREREWGAFYRYGKNMLPNETSENILKMAEELEKKYRNDELFVYGSNWVEGKDIVNFMKSGIKNAKTIEEYREEYCVYGLSIRLEIYEKTEKTYSSTLTDFQRFYIGDTEALIDCINEIKEKTSLINLETHYFYISVVFSEYGRKAGTLDKKIKKRKEANSFYKNKGKTGFVITVNDNSYFKKISSRHLWHSGSLETAKFFKTQKSCEKYLEDLKSKHNFEVDFGIKKIVYAIKNLSTKLYVSETGEETFNENCMKFESLENAIFVANDLTEKEGVEFKAVHFLEKIF